MPFDWSAAEHVTTIIALAGVLRSIVKFFQDTAVQFTAVVQSHNQLIDSIQKLIKILAKKYDADP